MPESIKYGLIAMPRTGHRAVMAWMRLELGQDFVKNIEGFAFQRSMDRAKIQGVTPWMLIRDYPNWVAACLKHWGDFVNLPPMIDAWITHAENVDVVPTILYPQWVSEGNGFKVERFDSAFSGGSVLDRWQEMKDNDLFKRYMERTDALELNAKLFPDMTYDGGALCQPLAAIAGGV